MGDRYFWNEDCPKCGVKDGVECYDAPSCYQFSRRCSKCGWSDDLNYFETSPHTLELLTEEEAKKRGLFHISGLEADLTRDKITGEARNKTKQ